MSWFVRYCGRRQWVDEALTITMAIPPLGRRAERPGQSVAPPAAVGWTEKGGSLRRYRVRALSTTCRVITPSNGCVDGTYEYALGRKEATLSEPTTAGDFSG